jgi:hypothetical protein
MGTELGPCGQDSLMQGIEVSVARDYTPLLYPRLILGMPY